MEASLIKFTLPTPSVTAKEEPTQVRLSNVHSLTVNQHATIMVKDTSYIGSAPGNEANEEKSCIFKKSFLTEMLAPAGADAGGVDRVASHPPCILIIFVLLPV